jgi:hypothetical protein
MHFSVCVCVCVCVCVLRGACIISLIVYYTHGLFLIILWATRGSFFLTPIMMNQYKTLLTVHSITPTLSKICLVIFSHIILGPRYFLFQTKILYLSLI